MKKFLSIILSALVAAPMAAGAAVFAEGEAAPNMLWDFGKDSVEMYDASSLETETLEDSVIFTAKGGDPNVKIAADIDDVESIAWVKIRVKNPSPAIAVELFASTDGDNHSLAGPECTHIDIVPYADEWQSYVAYLPNANIYTVNTFKGEENVEPIEAWNWQGACDYIRLDPMWRNTSGEMSDGDAIEIDYIAFFDNKEDAVAYAAEKDGDEETLGHAVLLPVEFEEKAEMPELGSEMFVNGSLRFIDITPDDGDYYEAAKYVYYEGLFKGISDTRFGPDIAMTRAMFVTVLGRANFIDTAKYSEKQFSDVEPDAWYGPYVKWAADEGLVLGYDDGTFRPDQNLTVEQAVAIVNRYAGYAGFQTETAADIGEGYSDRGDISDWAYANMVWASAHGVYTGVDGALTPKADAARKVVALMLYNFINADIPLKNDAPAVVGGWTAPDSPALTDEQKAAFEKAMDGFVGVGYTPVAVLGQQVVAGMNYLYICRARVIVPDAVEKYSFITVYADLDGGAKITDVIDTDVETNIPSESLDGGWWMPESPIVSDELKSSFDKAAEKLLGVDYTPVALLSQQVVSGMNYVILCESTVVTPDAETSYSFVTMYVNLEGEASFTDIINLAEAE